MKRQNKCIKFLSIILMTIMMVTIAVSSFAIEPANLIAKENVSGSNEITGVGQSIVGILQTVGIVLSVVVLIILGIKYMMGSAEEKADYKKSMMPYVVGAGIIFAASAFAQVIYQFFIGISTQIGG